jgi:8-amino-7-oxononanoate synthase
MRVADFTSSLYLGMRHSSADLPTWSALTSGRPAALGPPAGSAVAAHIAAQAGA